MEQSNDPQDKKAGGGSVREPSDRWDFASVPPPVGDLIPHLKEIPETPEERRRRRIILTLTGIASGIALVIAVFIALHLRHRSQIDGAVEEVENAGRAGALERALALLEGETSLEDQALLARLHATAALEHGRAESVAATRSMLQSFGDAPPRGADVAAVYLALAEGRLHDGHRIAAHLQSRGAHKVEALRAQALAGEAIGATAQAVPFARAAVDERPKAPRHAALLARLLGRTGEVQQALATLDRLGEKEQASPVARLARARLELEQDGWGEAVQLAKAVVEDESATAVERSWARVVWAMGAVRSGEADRALELAEAAIDPRPPADEDFTLLRGRTLLLAGAVNDAAAELEQLPSGVTRAPALRAHVVAELGLARGQLPMAEDALSKAPEGPRTLLLRGEVAAARGKGAEARELFRKAAEAERMKAEALTALARLELVSGNAQASVAAASKALSAAATHAGAVQVLAQAQAARGDAKAATKAVEVALKERPADGRLHAARGRLLLVQKDWAGARAALETATARLPRDAGLFADLGVVAQRMGDAKAARTALERAVDLDAKHAQALTALLQLAVAAEDRAWAAKVIELVDRAEVVSVDVDRARARYLVLAGAGQSGIGDVRRALLRRAPSDPDLWMALAQLQMQAGDAKSAAGSYGRVIREREGDPWALLGRAFAQIVMRMGPAAEKTLEGAEAAGKEANLGADFEADAMAARARLQLLDDRAGVARTMARRAAELDPRSAEAHMALADVEADRKRDPTPHLRDALEARVPPPEAKGRLALQLEPGDPQRCELAQAYRNAAPRGPFERAVQQVLRDCR
jgi:Tfp pilus assembly protein PilF